MTNPQEHPFQPGVEVAIVDRNRWGGGISYRTAAVAKVHKNGNIVLEGRAQQYRPSYSSWSKEWTATETGGGTYSGRACIEMITDKLITDMRDSERRAKFRNTVEQLSRLRDADVTDEELARLEILVARLSNKETKP